MLVITTGGLEGIVIMVLGSSAGKLFISKTVVDSSESRGGLELRSASVISCDGGVVA